MTQKRLNHFLLLHIHRIQTNALDLLGVAEESISRNSRREEYFVTIVSILTYISTFHISHFEFDIK